MSVISPYQQRLPFDDVATEPGPADVPLLEALGVDQGPAWPDRFGESLRNWARHHVSRPITTLSLFSGAGGLDLGFHDAGFCIHSMVELEPQFAATLQANSGFAGAPLESARVVCQDIRTYKGLDLPKIDFVLGGPPCQTFSAAGRRSHGVMGVDDPRGALFLEYLRLLELLEPEAFLFENVYGITGAQGGRPWRLIVESFKSAGYDLSYRILDTADYGVPQHRERLIIVGTRRRPFEFPRPTHGPDSPTVAPHFAAGTAIEDLRTATPNGNLSVRGRYGHLLNEIPPGLNYSYFTEKLGHPRPVFAWRSKFSDFLYKADPKMPVRTIKAQGGQYTGPFHWDSRRFTLDELKRLQTFPDSFRIHGNNQVVIHQIGNSVPPQLARILAIAIVEQVFGISPPAPLPKLSPSDQLSFRKLKRLRTESYEDKAKQGIRSISASLCLADAQRRVAHTYEASLSSGFDLMPTDHGPLLITEEMTLTEWRFVVAQRGLPVANGFRIIVSPRAGASWTLPISRVELRGESITEEVFTAVWKAFERALAQQGVKADLVQLNGYYQYPPALRARMSLEGLDSTTQWRIVSHVVEGRGVRRLLSSASLALAWEVTPDEVGDLCHLLRTLGYEVRNTNTNPQIPEGHYLVPYAFPTLTGMSVQLRKQL